MAPVFNTLPVGFGSPTRWILGNGDPNASIDPAVNGAVPGTGYQQLDTEPIVAWIKQGVGAATWLIYPWATLFGAVEPNLSVDSQVNNAPAGSSYIESVAAYHMFPAYKREWLKGTSGGAGSTTWVPKNSVKFARIVHCDPAYSGNYSDGSPEYPYVDLKSTLALVDQDGWTIILMSNYNIGGSSIDWPGYLVSIQAKPGRGVNIYNDDFSVPTIRHEQTGPGAPRVNLFDLNIWGEVLYNTDRNTSSINFWACFLFGRVRLLKAGNNINNRINFWRGAYAQGQKTGATILGSPIVIDTVNGSVIVQDNARVVGYLGNPPIVINAANDNLLIHDSVIYHPTGGAAIQNNSGGPRTFEGAHGRYNSAYGAGVTNIVAVPNDVIDPAITAR